MWRAVRTGLVGIMILAGMSASTAQAQRSLYLVRPGSQTDLQWLRLLRISPRGRTNDGIVVRLDPERAGLLSEAGIPIISLDRDPALPSAARWRDEIWHDHSGVGEWLDGLADAHPDIASRFELGRSVNDAPLHGIVIGTMSDDASEVRILGGHHGDELMGIEIPLLLARHLAEGYGVDPKTTDILNATRVYIVPLVNPDGRADLSRENANGVDLNRVYGYQYHHGVWSGDTDTSPKAGPYSQPEVRAVADQQLQHRFAASLSFHTVGQDITWWWNYSPHPCPDQAIAVELAQRYAGLACADGDCYDAMQGSDMYQSYGDTNDFAYGVAGGLDFTVEVGNEGIEHEWDHNRPALMDFLEQAQRGLRGRVTDASDGSPLQAMVRCQEAWPVFTTLHDGRYHRILGAGTWACTYWAPGYRAQTIESIAIDVGPATVLDVSLSRESEAPSFALRAVVVTTDCDYWDDVACAAESLPPACYGPPDDRSFFLTLRGLVVLDMATARADEPGMDLRVFEGAPHDAESYEVAVSADMTGPWRVIGTGSGTADFDLAGPTTTPARFVRIRDLGDVHDTASPGLDLDAVAWLPPSLPDPADEASDTIEDLGETTDVTDADAASFDMTAEPDQTEVEAVDFGIADDEAELHDAPLSDNPKWDVTRPTELATDEWELSETDPSQPGKDTFVATEGLAAGGCHSGGPGRTLPLWLLAALLLQFAKQRRTC